MHRSGTSRLQAEQPPHPPVKQSINLAIASLCVVPGAALLILGSNDARVRVDLGALVRLNLVL